MSRFEALVVDYGGVLTTPLQESLVAFSDELGIELQDLVRVALAAYAGHDDSLVVDFETGAISEEDFSKEFAQRLSDVSGKPVDPTDLVTRLFSGMKLEESMLEAVQKVKGAGFKTGLLSNSWGLGLYPRQRFGVLFDTVVISGEVGLRKPDPEIFLMTTKQLQVAPEACVFVDDHPGHLKAALDLGMTTVLHRSPDQSLPELEQHFGLTLS